jgi:hypothetical protein
MAVTLEALTTEAVLGDYENRVVQLGGQSPVVGNSNVGGAPRTWPSAPWGHWEAKEVARAKRMSLILGISLQAFRLGAISNRHHQTPRANVLAATALLILRTSHTLFWREPAFVKSSG